MHMRIVNILLICAVSILTGCASGPKLLIDQKTSSVPYCTATTIAYSPAYFDARFFGAYFGATVTAAGGSALINQMASDMRHSARYNTATPDFKPKDRSLDNDYEKNLGDFDTTAYVFKQLDELSKTSRFVKLTFVSDLDTSSAILGNIKASITTQTPPIYTSNDSQQGCIAAFKLVYGVGIKGGVESMGFRKTYRPFVRIVGAVKHLQTNTVIWEDQMLAFGDTPYVGDAINADVIAPQELIRGLQSASKVAISKLIQSLNGQEVEDRPNLIDTRRTDLTF